jgi:hypothetical protein
LNLHAIGKVDNGEFGASFHPGFKSLYLLIFGRNSGRITIGIGIAKKHKNLKNECFRKKKAGRICIKKHSKLSKKDNVCQH